MVRHFFSMFDKPFIMTQKAKNSLEQQAKACLRVILQSVAQIDENEMDKLMDLYELVSVKKIKLLLIEEKHRIIFISSTKVLSVFTII